MHSCQVKALCKGPVPIISTAIMKNLSNVRTNLSVNGELSMRKCQRPTVIRDLDLAVFPPRWHID